MIKFNSSLITTNRVLYAIGYLFWVAVVVWAAFGIFDRSQPLRVVKCAEDIGPECTPDMKPDQDKRFVLTPEIYPGEDLKVQTTAVPSRICDAKVPRAIYDSAGQRFVLDAPTDYTAATPAIIGEPITFIYTVPTGKAALAAPGEAEYRTQGFYICNFWQRIFGPITSEVYSIKFKFKARTPEQDEALKELQELLQKGAGQ